MLRHSAGLRGESITAGEMPAVNQIIYMGDKSPKSNQKKTNQKAKATVAAKKKVAAPAPAAKPAAKKKK